MARLRYRAVHAWTESAIQTRTLVNGPAGPRKEGTRVGRAR